MKSREKPGRLITHIKKAIKYIIIALLFLLPAKAIAQNTGNPYIQVLGIAQDGGYPHMGCNKSCCKMAWANDSLKKWVVSLALVDPATHQWWLFEATPDIKEQLHYFQTLTNGQYPYLPAGIFVTHAHIGHYTGLMQFGREVMNTKDVPVYALPRMRQFLTDNGPWSQLVKLQNIKLIPMTADSAIPLTDKITITAFTVPHRDEYSETAGFKIVAAGRRYLFIPDINKWDKWNRNIITEVKSSDIALIDATFYDDTELPGRKMSEVPHPFVTETMSLFNSESASVKAKIYFIHFNHTNPLLWDTATQTHLKKAGFNMASQGEVL